eukprot:m.261872 g.261872  ORF g.261872 m.261872 type:complete len:176 (+) comp26673_c0_seq16:6143-6670(+)
MRRDGVEISAARPEPRRRDRAGQMDDRDEYRVGQRQQRRGGDRIVYDDALLLLLALALPLTARTHARHRTVRSVGWLVGVVRGMFTLSAVGITLDGEGEGFYQPPAKRKHPTRSFLHPRDSRLVVRMQVAVLKGRFLRSVKKGTTVSLYMGEETPRSCVRGAWGESGMVIGGGNG